MPYVQWYESIHSQRVVHSNPFPSFEHQRHTQRRQPLLRPGVALGLVHVVRNGHELGDVQIVSERLALVGCPFRGAGLVAVSFFFTLLAPVVLVLVVVVVLVVAAVVVTHLPRILQRHDMVNVHIASLRPSLAVVLGEPRATLDLAAGARFDVRAVAHEHLVAGVASAVTLD